VQNITLAYYRIYRLGTVGLARKCKHDVERNLENFTEEIIVYAFTVLYIPYYIQSQSYY